MASASAPGARCSKKAVPVIASILRSEQPTLRGTLRTHKEDLAAGALVVGVAACLWSYAGVSVRNLAGTTWSFTTTTVIFVSGCFFVGGYLCRYFACTNRTEEGRAARDPAADE